MKTKKLLLIALTVLFTVCTALGLTVGSFAEETNDWIKISPTNKYVYTLDAQGNKGDFAFGAGNNANGLTIMIDLGMQSDGVTEEIDKCYVLSSIQIVNAANVTTATVEVSTDGEKFEKVLDITDFSSTYLSHSFTEINVRYVRIISTDAWATFWGDAADSYTFAFWGRAGQLSESEPEPEPEPEPVVTDAWIKIAPNSKYIYTLDSTGNKGTFAFNAENNCNGKVLMIDLGMQSDGTTAENDQCYIISKIQIVNFANVSNVTVEVSTDGIDYVKVVDTTDMTAWKEHTFNEINARYVRITPTGNWQTLWGAEYVVAFWGRAGQLAENNDPEGVTIGGYNSETVYPMVKGDAIQINASKINAMGDGEITYAITEGQSIATISSTGLLEITGTGDGQTEYTVTVSVPNPTGGNYTSQMKFVVLEQELAKITDIYSGSNHALLDFVAIQLVRVNGAATVEYSVDGGTYSSLTANTLLETPVCAQFLRVDGSDLAVYGIKNYGAATATAVTSQDINGFYPEHPLTNLIDGRIDNMAQTERSNFIGTDDVKGSVTIELDAFYDISGVRVFSFWNSLGDCSVSFSYDGVTFMGEEFFTLSYCNVASIGAEYYGLLVPFNPASAKYVRINIYGFGPTTDSFLAMREVTVYGTKITKTVTMTYDANTENQVVGMPDASTVVFGTSIEEPTAPQLTNYSFGGWYEDATCETAVVFPYFITQDTTIYAKWTALPTYTVTSAVTGQGSVIGVPDGAVYEGTQVTLTVSANEGWQVKEVKVNGITATLTDGQLTVTVTENTEITATFEEIPDEGGNQDGDNGQKTEKKGCGSSIGAVSMLSVTFVGVAAFGLKRKEN